MKINSFSRFRPSLFWLLGLLGSVPGLFPLSGFFTMLSGPQMVFSQPSSTAPKSSTPTPQNRRAASSATVTFQIHNPTQCSWEQMLLRSLKQIFGIDETQAQQLQPEFRWTFHDKTPLAKAGPFQIQMEASIYRLYLSKLGLVSENSSDEESTQEIKEAAKALFSERTGTPHSPHSSPDLLAVLEQEVSTAKSQLDQLPKELVQELADLLPPAPSSQGQSPTPSEPAPSLPSKPGSSSPQTPLADTMSPLPMPTPLSLTQRYPAKNWPQLRRILDKVRSLTPEERRLYRSLFSKTISDLHQMEQGLDTFLSLKQKLNASSIAPASQQVALTPSASRPSSPQLASSGSASVAHTASPSGSASGVGSVSPPNSSDSSQSRSSGSASLGEMDGVSLDDLQATSDEKQQLLALQKHIFSQFDPKSLPLLTPAQRKDLARSLSQQQTKAQLLHMAKHPLQTLNHLAESLLDTKDYRDHIGNAFSEIKNSNHSAYQRIAGGFSMGSRMTGQGGGWFALGALVCAPFLAPEILLAAGVFTVGLAITSIVLSSVEYEFRLEAAAHTLEPQPFVENTIAASSAQTNAIAGSLMIALLEGGRGFLKLPKIAAFTQKAHASLLKGLKQANLGGWKKIHLPSLRTSYQQALSRFFQELKQSFAQHQHILAQVESGEALLQHIIQGDEPFARISHLSKEQAQHLLTLVKFPPGQAEVAHLLAQLKTIAEHSQQLVFLLEEQTKTKLESQLHTLEQANTLKSAKEALATLEQTFSETVIIAELKQGIEAFAQQQLEQAAHSMQTAEPLAAPLPPAEQIPIPTQPSLEPSSNPAQATEQTVISETSPALKEVDPKLTQELEETFATLKPLSKAFAHLSFDQFFKFAETTWREIYKEDTNFSSFSHYLSSIQEGLQEIIRIREESSILNQKQSDLKKISAKENIAFANINLEGFQEKVLAASQEQVNLPKIIRGRKVLNPKDFPGKPFFEPELLPNEATPRGTDAEYRIFEYVARQLIQLFGDEFYHASGNITLFSERYFCRGCRGIIDKFQKQFPKIKLKLQAGPKLKED